MLKQNKMKQDAQQQKQNLHEPNKISAMKIRKQVHFGEIS
jgi:hypothetical protein